MKAKTSTDQKILSFAVLALALALLYIGAERYYEVHPEPTIAPSESVPTETQTREATLPEPSSSPTSPEPSIPAPPETQPAVVEISDSDLVVNATFSGVVRRGDSLYLTYDPANKQGKQACPT